ncbi:ALI_collapsed_G0025340.mRNA.1.CDS.1 [Saccharomyces cerevisiae]|nr:ALI_collapsed_G0025340.mRNA.1.CDS.1 [Saccharomyces cerevisiae]
MNNNVEELLRRIPLYNKYGKEFPQETVTRFQMPEFKLPALQPTRDLLCPWYKNVTISPKSVSYMILLIRNSTSGTRSNI